MTTSGSTFPSRLTRIDDLTRPDHSYLSDTDDCFFLGEYTARQGFAFSRTNDIIINFKKSPRYRGHPSWKYKRGAISNVAAAFRAALNAEWLNQATLVPTPPSKAKDHAEYDDRVLEMLRQIRRQPPLDIRELVTQTATTSAAHESDDRPSPSDLVALYQIDAALTAPAPRAIGVFDDMLTTGSHFVAMKRVLARQFPSVPILGFFIARRVPDTSMDFEELFGSGDA